MEWVVDIDGDEIFSFFLLYGKRCGICDVVKSLKGFKYVYYVSKI